MMEAQADHDTHRSSHSTTESFVSNISPFDTLPIAARQQELLDIIDKVRRTTTTINLPQIVVVGDQSSGKSSVLEAITTLKFPVRGGKCTQFPIQISVRRGPNVKVAASIIPYDKRPPEQKKQLQEFSLHMRDCNIEDLHDIVESARNTIWPGQNNIKDYAMDILSIEAVGPRMPNLSVIDLPGYVLINAQGRSGEDSDAEQVMKLAERFTRVPRTIILAIVHAATDYENQNVLKQHKKIDPQGARTIGVITKPDIPSDSHSISEFIQLAKNDRYHLKLGWYVLKNRKLPDDENLSWDERNEGEKSFFNKHPDWAQAGQERLGIFPLVQKLQRILFSTISQELPSILKQLQQARDECAKKLTKLGDCPSTVLEMREQLRRCWVQCQGTVTQGVHGQYMIDQEFFNADKKLYAESGISIYMLRACIAKQNEIFDRTLRDWGCAYDVVDNRLETPSKIHYGSAKPELVPPPRKVTRAQFITEDVEPLLKQHRGQQNPGDIDPTVVYPLFQKLSSNWQPLVEDHVRRVYLICSIFMQLIIQEKWPTRMQDSIRKVILNEQMDTRLASAHEEVTKIFTDHSRYMQTHDPEYIRTLWNLGAVSARPTDADADVSISFILCEDILTKTWVYYNIALGIFLRNIIVQVIERHLVYGLIDIFDQSHISTLDDEQIKEIAEESEEEQKTRDMLRDEKKRLDDCVRTIQNISWGNDWRHDLGMHSIPEWKDPRNSPAPRVSEPGPSPVPKPPPSRRGDRPATTLASSSRLGDTEPSRAPEPRTGKPVTVPFPPPGFLGAIN
ncbi:hypothetical protein RU639_011827 [Aspergillus parasiticus]